VGAASRVGRGVVAFVWPPRGRGRRRGARPPVLDHIARFKRPRHYRFVDALPKNNYGKVLKTDCAASWPSRNAKHPQVFLSRWCDVLTGGRACPQRSAGLPTTERRRLRPGWSWRLIWRAPAGISRGAYVLPEAQRLAAGSVVLGSARQRMTGPLPRRRARRGVTRAEARVRRIALQEQAAAHAIEASGTSWRRRLRRADDWLNRPI